MTSVPGTSRSSERAVIIEAGVLAAAERLLVAGSSFSALTMQQIAAEAGLARSTLYLYFPEKNTILIKLAGRLSSGAFTVVSRWCPADPRGLDGLAETLLDTIRYYRGQAHLLRAVVEMADHDPVVGRFWDAELGKFIGLSRFWISGELNAGRTAADIDVETASQIIVYGGNRVIGHQVLGGDPARDPAVAEELAVNQWYGAIRRPSRE
jgi:AcrR family transcriptional regulator